MGTLAIDRAPCMGDRTTGSLYEHKTIQHLYTCLEWNRKKELTVLALHLFSLPATTQSKAPTVLVSPNTGIADS
jgi:hypothetical protein